MDSTAGLFSGQAFMPHGHCYLWTPAMVWLQAGSNLAVGLSYVAISALLVLFVRRHRALPFRLIYVSFGVFILSCGLTHFMDVLVIWYPRYWLDAGVRVVTAIASVGTAALLPSLLPKAAQLVHSSQLMRERGIALEAAVLEMEAVYKKTVELDQLKTNFFANISHELRTPLTLILGPVQNLMLQHDKLDLEQRRELEMVARNARSLLGHVTDLLDIARLDAGKLEPCFSAVDLCELVRFTTANFDSLARDRDITLSVRTPSSLVAEVDSDKLQRVLLNLLSNAFKFTPAGGQIRVELQWLAEAKAGSAGGPCARLMVADSGPGVPMRERQQIFERFRQGAVAARRPVGGTGLGLSIVREFVALHRGEVHVEDAPEGGALFVAVLPVYAPEHASLEETSAERVQNADAVLHGLRQPELAADDFTGPSDVPLVLVVEDNPDMRELLTRTLRTRYRVAAAHDGQAGIDKAARLLPDLILSDLTMPDVSGDELVCAVRKIPALNSVPILLLSAKSDELLRTRTLETGAQDYVLKPFSSEELLARVHNLLTIKRTRDLLQSEVEAQQEDVESLSRQVVAQKRELSSALQSAREARQLAEQASRAKSDFLSLVSHELRTPLTSIQLQLERLRRGVTGNVSNEQVQAMDKIARSSARLLDLLEALLEFGRIESGRLEVSLGELDLGVLVREVVEELRPRAEHKGIELAVRLESEQVVIQSDARLVRLIIVNLLDNAIKYTERGAIEVRLAPADTTHVCVQVSDTGPGIEPSLQQLIFEPFQQLEHVRHKRGAGVGLGLALVKSIARALHAEIAVESEVGRGSAFTITLSAV
jgi:signal transduction histidine kinase